VRWLNKSQAAALLGLSPHTLRRYRERGEWQAGIHYSKVAANHVVYNERLILDWVANRNNPAQHRRAIEQYLTELSANGETPKTTRRKGQRQHPA
jgi:DNA-binding transcriptional MerR regulator